jgi:NADH-quinone oxidoreductase subunit D
MKAPKSFWSLVDDDMLEQEKQPDSVHYGESNDESAMKPPVEEKLPQHPAADDRVVAAESGTYTIRHDFRPYVQYVRREANELGDQMVLSMGPQHPSTHGVLRVELVLSGEEVADLRCHIGYMHRCAEKESENSTYPQVVPYTDRLDYVAPMTNAYAYSLAVERLGRLSVPEDVEYFRIAINELERIASHLLAIGTFGIDIGAFTPFLYAFEAREKILKFFEYLSGGHLLYNYIWPGGVQRQPPPDVKSRIEEILRDVEIAMANEINPVLTGNRVFLDRTAAVGIITPEVGLAYAITGPNLRGSGARRDLRRDEPSPLYDKLDFEVCVGHGTFGPLGSALDRFIVRVEEITESIKIVRQCLGRFPESGLDVHAGLPASWNIPAGECYFRFETARGELGIYLIADGTNKPSRCKYRSPGFHAIQLIPEIARGHYLADLPVIIGSLDFVMCEVDR